MRGTILKKTSNPGLKKPIFSTWLGKNDLFVWDLIQLIKSVNFVFVNLMNFMKITKKREIEAERRNQEHLRNKV